MAVPATEAFGAYLRQLRERKGLSLDDVESLSSSFPDPVGKAYLSRCENGKLKIAFSKTIALSRIYDVPSEVLSERMRLDLEVDRLGGPDTDGMTFREMFDSAWTAAHEGDHWIAYARLRDALRSAGKEPVLDVVSGPEEQTMACRISIASVAATLGARRFSVHELASIERGTLGPYYSAVLLDRLSMHARLDDDLARAAALGDEVLAMAAKHGLDKPRPSFLENRARTHVMAGEFEDAIEVQQEAIRNYDGRFPEIDRLSAYLRLGEIYIDARRHAAARRTLNVALKNARSTGFIRLEAQAMCLLGDVDYAGKRLSAAKQAWRGAHDRLRSRHENKLKFAILFRLYRLAQEQSDAATARSLERRLRRLLPSVPRRLEEAIAFRDMIG